MIKKMQTEDLYDKGRHNFIGGVRKGEAGKYVIAADNGILKLKEDMTTNTDFVQYDEDNLLAINARNHNDGLSNYRHRTKPDDYADAYSYNQHLGYAFHMDVVIDSNQNILDLYCDPNDAGSAASGYDATLKSHPAGASQHF